MTRKRLLHITHDLKIGGLQQVVVNLCKYTNNSKFFISVLCLRECGVFAGELEKHGVPVYLLPQKDGGIDYLAFRKIAVFLKNEKIDIIHTHNTQPFIDGVLGAFLSRQVKTIIHTDHARKYPDKKRYMLAERFLSHYVDKVVGVSDDTTLDLMEYVGIAANKLVTIYNGVDPIPFRSKVDRQELFSSLGIVANGPVIGLGVRLVEQKGLSYLLSAMPEILSIFPTLSLIVAGEGDLELELKKEARALGIHKNVFFVGPRMNMPQIIKSLDLYVLPSLWEGLPMVLLEAMAAGCPIIATDVGGNSVAIKDGVNGVLVPPQNPTALANAIVMLLCDKTKREEYVRISLEIFHKRFSAGIMARSYEKLYLSNE